ncbi:MAG: hypothetical protein EOO65_05565 [Methanosarcinales archaeon]|nr:MAG: hypothetical protein EOO65_05565 [Methanosarcinales archaeon]
MSAPIPASRAGDASTHEHGDGAKDPQPALLRMLKPEDVEDADTRMLCKDLEPIKRLGDEPFNAVTVFGKARYVRDEIVRIGDVPFNMPSRCRSLLARTYCSFWFNDRKGTAPHD